MNKLRIILLPILLAVCVSVSVSGYARGEAVQPPRPSETVSAAQIEAGPAKEDNRLPIHKQDQWQFFLSPYMWIAGANLQTTFKGHTSSVDVPWWDVAADLFSNVIGVMGRFEAWKGRWGLYLDSYFVYLGELPATASGSETIWGCCRSIAPWFWTAT